MSVHDRSLVFNERRGNHPTIGENAAGPKKLYSTSTANEISLYTKVTLKLTKGENETMHTEAKKYLTWDIRKKNGADLKTNHYCLCTLYDANYYIVGNL